LDKLLDGFLAPKLGKEFNIKMQVCRPTGYDLQPPLDFYLWGHVRTTVQLALIKAEETLHHRIFYACQTIRSRPETFDIVP
jgi:hypothetical protein